MDKVKICIEEAGWILQLRVVADVFVQNGERGPLDQLPAGGDISVRKSAMTDCLNISGGGGEHLLVKTNELWMGVDGVQGAVDHVH